MSVVERDGVFARFERPSRQRHHVFVPPRCHVYAAECIAVHRELYGLSQPAAELERKRLHDELKIGFRG